MISNKPYYFCDFTLLELCVVMLLIAVFSYSAVQGPSLQSGHNQYSVNMAAMPSTSTINDLSEIHDTIDALPIDPEIRQQMLLYIEIAEAQITDGNIGDAREAVLDFCRRIEWYRYQIGHTKIDDMFNQAMSIAVELHNAAVG